MDNESAFPQHPVRDLDNLMVSAGAYDVEQGMTLRDYFAAKAMQACATNPVGADGFTFSERAIWAYAQADAMLRAREKK